jgi:hypothetical protein
VFWEAAQLYSVELLDLSVSREILSWSEGFADLEEDLLECLESPSGFLAGAEEQAWGELFGKDAVALEVLPELV